MKYPSGPVFFTSRNGSGASPRNVWSIDVSDPTVPFEIWSDNPGSMDAAPTRFLGKLYVGSQAGAIYEYPEAGSTWNWNIPYGDGPVQAPIFPVFGHNTILFTTDTELHSVELIPIGACGSAPCPNWTHVLGANASPVLQIPGTNAAYVGLSNGSLEELVLDLADPRNPATRISHPLSPSALGGPTFSIFKLMLYVGDTGGRVYGIPWPLP